LWPYQADDTTDTKPSFGEARQKIRPEALTEWNAVFVNRYDDDEDIAHFTAFAYARSTVPLSHCLIHPSCGPNIGVATGKGSFAVAKSRASPFDDVLNGIVVEARIAPFRTGERKWARQPVEVFLRLEIRQIATVMLFDRGYPSLPLLFYLTIPPSPRCNRVEFVNITAIPGPTVGRVSPTGRRPYALGDAMVDAGTEHQPNKARNHLPGKVFMVFPAGFEPAASGIRRPACGGAMTWLRCTGVLVHQEFGG